MQLSFFDNHEYVEFQNFRSDAERIIRSTNSTFVFKQSEIVIKIVNEHSIWFYNSDEGTDPIVRNWSTRSLEARPFLRLSKFVSYLI